MDNSISWQSVKWKDGATYEGLVKDDFCHLRGVFKYPDGSRYMGEYVNNNMEGYGVYVWRDGTVYRGQWKENAAEGCGVKISKQPDGRYIAEEGHFVHDEWIGEDNVCSLAEARRAAGQADVAAQMARVFESKPSLESSAASTVDRQPVVNTITQDSSRFLRLGEAFGNAVDTLKARLRQLKPPALGS
jgi:hypothetical protein